MGGGGCWLVKCMAIAALVPGHFLSLKLCSSAAFMQMEILCACVHVYMCACVCVCVGGILVGGIIAGKEV